MVRTILVLNQRVLHGVATNRRNRLLLVLVALLGLSLHDFDSALRRSHQVALGDVVQHVPHFLAAQISQSSRQQFRLRKLVQILQRERQEELQNAVVRGLRLHLLQQV